MNNLRCEVSSFQGWLSKLDNCRDAKLCKELSRLKSNMETNSEQFFRIEQDLNLHREAQIRDKVENMKLFENLSSEKPSPLFLSLARSTGTGKLSSVNDDTGSAFLSDTDRHQYILNKYEELFKKDNLNPLNNNSINNFLGPEISNHPHVIGCKLTDAESRDLDSPLTLAELDLSAKKGNLKSAPGADSFSNKFIITCWKFLRMPLFNYANTCFTKGTLTHNFRSARIKLIPKKGNLAVLPG
jgi:hypothetical protein